MKLNIILALAAFASPVFSASVGHSAKSNHDNIITRAASKCYNGPKAYGCDKNSCWTQCGQGGQWCWLARKGGVGDWMTCKNAAECAPSKWGDASCSQCSKESCGCSC